MVTSGRPVMKGEILYLSVDKEKTGRNKIINMKLNVSYRCLILTLLIGSCAVLISGCVGFTKPEQRFKHYRNLVVHVSSKVPNTEDIVVELERDVLKPFLKSGAFETVLLSQEAIGRAVDARLNITITKAKRHSIVISALTQRLAGRGNLQATFKLSDGRTGQLIAVSNTQASGIAATGLAAGRIYLFSIRHLEAADNAYFTQATAPSVSQVPSSIIREPRVVSPHMQRTIDFGNYHALVIGINNYQHLPCLKTAKNDAIEVAQILESDYGFSVKTLYDASRTEILMELGGYRRSLTDKDNLLVYYAGHGWLDEAADEGYWLPVDATRDSEVNWVSNSSITSAIRAIRAKHVMVVADSCYSGKLVRGIHITRKDPDYLGRIAQKKARVVLSSGGLEPVVDVGANGTHSVFATAFIEALQENKEVLDGTELFSKIRRPVMVNSDQTPEYGDIRKAGHGGGDFLFVRHK
jgi:hypothetical protein